MSTKVVTKVVIENPLKAITPSMATTKNVVYTVLLEGAIGIVSTGIMGEIMLINPEHFSQGQLMKRTNTSCISYALEQFLKAGGVVKQHASLEDAVAYVNRGKIDRSTTLKVVLPQNISPDEEVSIYHLDYRTKYYAFYSNSPHGHRGLIVRDSYDEADFKMRIVNDSFTNGNAVGITSPDITAVIKWALDREYIITQHDTFWDAVEWLKGLPV